MYRKGVSALIANDNNEFLLVNLESFEKKYFAIPGGGIDPGETPEEAVYREIYEELGIKKNLLQLVGQSKMPLRFKFKEIKLTRDGKTYEGSERHFFGFRFIGSSKDIKPLKREVRTYQWVPPEQFKNYLIFDNQLEETSEKIMEIFSQNQDQVSTERSVEHNPG